MKLLFDQNISPKIVKKISEIFPDSNQVRFVDLENESDIKIFDFAKINAYTIVTFDSDFVDLNIINGIPPKIIWRKTGNMSTDAISELLYSNRVIISNFIQSEESEILEILQ